MILSDASIKAFCTTDPPLIYPFHQSALQPASYDLVLAELDTYTVENTNDTYVIYPGQFVLGSTYERVAIPPILQGKMDGKSSWARKGLIIHTAGFIDPGFQGDLVLEITNLSGRPVIVHRGDPIAQISFQLLDRPAERPYGSKGLGSHYQDQKGITKSAI